MEKVILCELPKLADGQLKQRIQVFPKADDYVHPRSGPFSLTREHLDEFAADINSREIPSDRDHAFYKGMPAPAAGWLVKGSAEATDAGVTAEVEWTPAAAEQVRTREYRFISPEFSFQKAETDGTKVAEPTLHAITLTNRPFFKTMAPIAAEDLELGDELMVAEEFGERIADTLLVISADAAREVIAAAASKSPYGNVAYADPGYRKDGKKRYPVDTEEHVRAAWSYINQKRNGAMYSAEQLSRIKARIKRAAKKFGITIGADSTAGGDMDLTALAAAAGLTVAADASEEDVLEAIKTQAAENASLKEKLEKAPGDDQMKTLIASAAKGEAASAKLAVMERDQAITAAVEDGRITAAEKSHYESFWGIDPEGTAKLLAEKAPAVPFKPLGSEATTVPVMGADGKPVAAQATDGATVLADLTPVLVDSVPTPVGEDRAKVHAAAIDLLRKQGVKKTDDGYADAYVAACVQAAGIVGVEL